MAIRTVSWLKVGALALALGLAACSPEAPFAQKGAPCDATHKCAAGLTCGTDGKCVEDAHLVSTCTLGDKQCQGSNVVVCATNKDTGLLGWDIDSTCAGGCKTDATAKNAACATQICDPNSTDQGKRIQCQGDEVVTCKADGTGWEPKEHCSLGCDQATSTCIAAVCSPNARKCDPDGSIETCASNGSGWTKSACGDNARCVSNGQSGGHETANCLATSCTPNATRCDGLDLVQCAADGSAETRVKTCANACGTDASGAPSCVDASCLPGTTRCTTDGKSIQRCNALGNAYDTTSCDLTGSGNGVCLLSPGASGGDTAACISPICQPSTMTCENDHLLTCDQTGLSQAVTACAYGCKADKSACADPVCAAGATQCNGDVLETCAPDRRSWVFDQFCAGHCTTDGATTGARCGFTMCAPFVSRCTVSGQIEQCSADGTTYDKAQDCPSGEVCTDGACVSPPAVCNDGATRCNGHDLEKCQAPAGKPAGFVKYGACLGTCSGTGCDGAGECSAFNLNLPLTTPGKNLPADGVSTILVLSDPLVGPSGLPVPEGTLVTVAIDAPGTTLPALLSGDADPTTPGLQIPVVDGRIDFLVRVPLLATGTLTASIKAQIGDRVPCSGVTQVTFDSSITDRFVGEDFSTTRTRDGSGPITQWDTRKGVLNLTAFDAGDGRDGDLTVDVGATVDLTTRVQPGNSWADETITPVREIRGALVALNGDPAPFAKPGTRVLLMNLQGSGPPARHYTNVGTWETGIVAGVENGFVRLTAPVARVYGEGGNTEDALSDQAVRLIRVPQYRKVTVNGTLTAAPVSSTANGVTGGVLAFMASASTQNGAGPSIIQGVGKITMSGRGYRGADKPADTAPRSINGNTTYYAGAAGNTGEGIDGELDIATAAGSTSSGGGFCCGSGDVAPRYKAPSDLSGAINWPDYIDEAFVGSSGSYATTGASTCPSVGPGQTMGDGLLGRLIPGGGSGSVSRSTAHACLTTRKCAKRTSDPSCCRSGEYLGGYAGDGNTVVHVPTFNYPVSGVACANGGGSRAASDTTGGCDVYCSGENMQTYCDAHTFLYDKSFAGAPGGGVIFATFAELQMKDTSDIESQGAWTGMCDVGQNSYRAPSSVCFGGAGGSIYLKVKNATFGAAGRLLAQGGTAPLTTLPGGGDGRVRLDVVSSDLGTAAVPVASKVAAPAAAVVTIDGDTVRSLPVLTAAAGTNITGATGIAIPVGQPIPFLSTGDLSPTATGFTQLTLSLSADAGASYGATKAADGSVAFSPATGTAPFVGTTAKWQMFPAAGMPNGSTRGFIVKYTIK